MTCANCARHVQDALAAVPGVASVAVNFISKQARVNLGEPPPATDQLLAAMTGRERFLKTLRFEEPDRPPHFEIWFQLTREAFGVERCMVASNFPVDSLCADFGTILGGFREIAVALGLDAAAQRALFHDNADRIYDMRLTASPRRAGAR